MPRNPLLAAVILLAAATPATAQSGGPLALLLPASARPAALGNAWVAGRDEYAVFSNPATAQATAFVSASLASYGGNGNSIATAGGAAIGPTTFGWGVHFVNSSFPRTDAKYPYDPADLARTGDADNSSMVALLAARIIFKGFTVGVAGKYAQDIAPREVSSTSTIVVPTRGSALLADIGTTHPLWTGIAGLALQNIGEPYTMGGREVEVPTQLALGWTKARTLGPFDFGFAGQATLRRHGWVGVGGGMDLSYSWIEGISVGARVGARRTETDDERPVALGATVNFDRFNFEYGLGFYAGDKYAHRLTMRIR
jgi:hypothetical protein